MAGNDFVQVQLTAAGIKLADGQPLRISQDRRSLVFTPGQTTRVERSFEWNHILAKYVAPTTGDLVFELAPEPAAVPAPASSAKTAKAASAPVTTPAVEPAANTSAAPDASTKETAE